MELVLLRHGESTWNLENRFTGWTDVDLTRNGSGGGRRVRPADGRGGPRVRDRPHLGALAGHQDRRHRARNDGPSLAAGDAGTGASTSGTTAHCRASTRRRRPTSTEPTRSSSGGEAMTSRRRLWPAATNATPSTIGDIPICLPRSSRAPSASRTSWCGCCPTGTTGSFPTWCRVASPLIVAHGNSLRALVKHLDGLTDQEVVDFNIPTGIPLVYNLDDSLRAVSRRYLGDADAAAAAAEAVARQAG